MSDKDFSPGLAGVIATESSISDIDGERGILFYRGYPIADLVKNCCFEEVALLLILGDLPSQRTLDLFTADLRRRSRVKFNIRNMMFTLPNYSHPMEILQTCISAMGAFYPDVQSASPDSDYSRSAMIKIISNMSTLVAMWEHIRHGYDPVMPRTDLGYASNFLYMFKGKEPDEDEVKIFDACLVLHAEHTINASTFANMVTASTLAKPFAAIASAVGALAGPLHGGANERVLNMIKEIDDPKNARSYVENKLAKKEVIWGLGHREYKTKDPRATILQELITKFMKGRSNQYYEVALAVEEVCDEILGHKGVYPNVDFYSGILYQALGFPVDQFTPIFAISRSAGWMAHWREQMGENRIFRPTQKYIGKSNRLTIPISQR